MLPRTLTLLLVVLLVAAVRDLAPARARAQPDTPPFLIAPGGDGAPLTPGDEAVFSVEAPEPGATYIWSFGDGTVPVSGPRVAHRFATVDDYTVTLAVRRGGNQSPVGSRTVRVMPDVGGLFAADGDGQITPADLFQMAAPVRAPGLDAVAVRLAGPVIRPWSSRFSLSGEEDWLIMPEVRVLDEDDAVIQERIIAKPDGAIPLGAGVIVLTLDYTTRTGRQASVAYSLPVRDFNQPDQTVAITYPRIAAVSGGPPDGMGTDDYYLRGDPDFNHLTDPLIRRLALAWGRRGEAWPDDPAQVALNLYRTIDGLLGDGDPGDFDNDLGIARKVDSGEYKLGRHNGSYICIAQAYLLASMARTLGFPAREFNNAIGEPLAQGAGGVWRVKWWQEAGVELWYAGDWHYFDTWLEVTDRRAYLQKNLIYQSWTATGRANSEFKTVRGEPTGLHGHDFNAWPGDPPQWTFVEEVVRPGVAVEGSPSDPSTAPITRVPSLTVSRLPDEAGGASRRSDANRTSRSAYGTNSNY